MNNVAQKNIIYNLSANQTMPYQQTNDVSLKANQIIYTSLNHTFRKMVDNDLFIEKLLLDKRNYQYGPKNVTSSEIDTAPDGYKMWPNDLSNRNNELSIIRKDVLPVSASGYSNGNIRSKVNFIAHDGYYGWLVGADDGLFQISGDLSSAQRLNSIKTTSYFTTSRSTFAATENGLWNLSTDAGGISKISDMSANALGIIDQTVFLGRNDGIYQGKLSGYGLSAYGFDKTTEIESNVNSMYFPDSKSGLAAADDGLYEGESSHVLQLSGEMVECDGVRFMKKLDGRVFIATATKLFRYGDAEPLLMASNINAVCKYGDSYYVAVGGNSSQKGVHRINILTKIVTDTAIKKCAYDVISYKDYILVSTKDGICFSTDKLQTYDVIGGTPTSTRHTFGALGDIAFNIDGTSVTKLQTAVSSYTSLSAIQSDVLDSYYAGSVSYIAKPDGLYDSNFDKLDEWHADVTAASFQNITKSFNDGIYVFTNAGVYKVVSGSSLSSMTTDTLKQVKCTDQCVFRLNADGKLQYSENTSNFYDPALVWEDIADGVSAIDTESNALYFLKTNKVYRVTITTKVAVEKYVGTEDGATSEIDAQFIENAMAYYADGTANLNYILSTDGAHVQADFGGDT